MAASLGDIIYAFSSTVWKRLVGNTSTTVKYLTSIGSGSAATAPTWRQPSESDLAFTDITTGDVSTTKHGFAPKASGVAGEYLDSSGAWSTPAGSGTGTVTHTGALTADQIVLGNGSDDIKPLGAAGTTAQVLHGNAAGAPSFGAVVEADISLSDNTTNDVSTSKHGLVPKASGVSGEYLDASGGWSTPSGSGSGTVTHSTGALTSNQVVIGNGSDDIKPLGSAGTTTQVLHGNAAGAPSFGAVVEGDLSLSDNTTGNVSTSAHGFAPKAPNDATKFLDGAAAYDTVKDSDLSTSDITTNDVSTSKHGFVPKLPNDATKYLDGTGAFSVPAGSGTGDTIVRKTADETVNNSTTLQNDDHLTFAVGSNKVYLFEMTLFLTSPNNTADWKIKFTGPSGFTMLWATDGSSGGLPTWGGITAGSIPPALNSESTTLSFGHNASGGPAIGVHVRGYIETSATSGTFTLQWAQDTADASNSVVKKNSFIRYRDIT